MGIRRPIEIDWEDALLSIISNVSEYIDRQVRAKERPTSPLQDLLFKGFADLKGFQDDNTDLINRCYRLDPKAREIIKKLILKRLTEINGISTLVVDTILRNYHINYYGSPTDITSSKKVLGISMVNRILIPASSEYDTKLEKLAQVVYQELYGLSVVDEFMFMEKQGKHKIEEVATFGPNAFWIMVSGNRVKLDRVVVPKSKLKQIAERLAKCAYRFTLNPKNNRVSTDSLNGDRVSLTADTYSKYYEFNVRRAYPYVLTRKSLIEWKATSEGFENFQDDLMLVAPRAVVVAEQAAGKSSMVRRLAERYPDGTTLATLESAYELNLGDISHLIVKELKVRGIDPEVALDDTLRFALQLMIYGEARSGKDWSTTLQAAKRSSGGTIATGHASDIMEFISSVVQLLLRDKIYTSEEAALNAIVECLDLFIMPACDNIGDDATGHRYIDSVWEIPKGHVQFISDVKPRLLFKAKDMYTLEQVSPISPELEEVLHDRMKGKFKEQIYRMAHYNYDKCSSWEKGEYRE